MQSLVYFSVGYKYTKSSKRGKNFPQDFFHYFSQKTLAKLYALNFSMLKVLDTINKSKSHDFERNLSPMILTGKRMVYS